METEFRITQNEIPFSTFKCFNGKIEILEGQTIITGNPKKGDCYRVILYKLRPNEGVYLKIN